MDLSVLIALGCLHFQGMNTNPNSQNQVNPGIALQTSGMTVGAYYNSERSLSAFGVYTPFRGWFQPFVGVVTGYKNWKPVGPAMGVAIEPWHKSGPVFTITPMNANGGFVLGVAWKQHIGG